MNMNESFKECKKIILELNNCNVKNVSIKCGFGNNFDLIVDNTNLISDARIDVVHVLLHGMQQGIISYRNANEGWKD